MDELKMLVQFYGLDHRIICFLAILASAIGMVFSEPRVINVNNPSPDDQVDILQLRLGPTGQMRNALKSNAQNRWTKYRAGKSKYLVPFLISGSFSQSERQIIRKAMHSIDKNTCVRFKARKREADYVDIQNQANQGCFTMVGLVRGQNQVMLESSPGATCVSFVTVVHELLHKLGLWHEQMRFDRDKFIKVHWENIPGGFRTQFEKVPSSMSSVYGVRYDYRSAMHYTKNAFASSADRVTMETRVRRYQNVIGMAKRASKGDWTKICAMYKCRRCMGRAFRRRKGGKKTGSKGKRRRTEPTWLGRDSPTLLGPNGTALPMGMVGVPSTRNESMEVELGEDLTEEMEVEEDESDGEEAEEDESDGEEAEDDEEEVESGPESEEEEDELDDESNDPSREGDWGDDGEGDNFLLESKQSRQQQE